MTALVAAVDGGGTKTAAALADAQGVVTFLPLAGGCNPQDNPDWAQVLAPVIDAIAARRGLARVTLGLPGWSEVPADDAAMSALVAARLPCPAEILNDVELAFHGAFPDGRGVLVLAGTGSMAFAGGPAGIVRAGGWGDLIGDEGSAFWIGSQGLRRAAQEIDGRAPETGFAARLLEALHATGRFAPLAWVMAQAQPRPAVAGVARVVDRLADAGCAVSGAILVQAAAELARTARAAARRAGLHAPQPWTGAGSVFRSATLRAALASDLDSGPTPARMDALGGGLWRAAQAAGWQVTEGWTTRVTAATRAWSGQA